MKDINLCFLYFFKYSNNVMSLDMAHCQDWVDRDFMVNWLQKAKLLMTE